MDIYISSLQKNGKNFTKKHIGVPNHSEHQAGLAVDLCLNTRGADLICPSFPYEGICDKFRKVAPNYGFIERYKKGKEDITGMAYKSWHFRYVGYPHSKIIEELSLSLEEYIEFIKVYQNNRKFMYEGVMGEQIEIFYVPYKKGKYLFNIPVNVDCQISGNNVDGFIVTIWRKKNNWKKRLILNMTAQH